MEHRLISEDQHKFVIRHPAGHNITIAKAGLQPAVIAKIKKMPVLKMADGGEVPDAGDSGIEGVSDSTPLPQSIASPLGAADPSAPSQAIDQIMSPTADPTANLTAAAAPTAQVAQDPSMADRGPASVPASGASVQDPMAAYNKAFAQEQSGIQGGAKAQTDLGNANAKALSDMMESQKQQAVLHQQNLQKINGDLDQSMQSYMNGKIDPNRLWHQAGTGNKIAASIGLVLSGMGSGLTGQPNQALEVMNKLIDRDVDAQRMDLDKKHTLYSMNLQKYRNENDAFAATKLDLLNAAHAQLQMNAAKAQGPAAQAQAQMALAQIGVQKAQLAYQLSGNMAQAQSLGLGGQGGGLPVNHEPLQLLADPKYQKKRVIVDGRAYQSNAEDGQDMRNQEALLKPTLAIVDKLRSFGPWSSLSPNDRAQAKALGSALAGSLASLKSATVGSKRISDAEIELGQNQFRDPTKLSQFVGADVTNQQLVKTLLEQAEQSRATNLIGYKPIKQAVPSAQPGFAANGR